MNENRRQVLQMLAAGQITADEAERLIAALEKEPPGPSAADSSESRPKAKPKYLRVVAEDAEGKGGPMKVNVRIPLQLIRAGVKLGSILPAQALKQANVALHAQGMQIDLTQLKPENLEEVIEQLADLSLDVDGSKTKVKMFCE